MVLLTSSTVSAMISGGVICVFTFLLFLSGYILQQQSMRSIQEAIRRPPEPKPVPTLPARFREVKNETVVGVLLEKSAGEGVLGAEGGFVDGIQVPIVVNREEARKEAPPQRLAYIFTLEEPSHLCSALLFAKHHRSTTRLSKEPSIVLLYPSTWESSSSPIYTSTLSFMRDVQELYDLIYRPVQIHDGWDDRSLLLGELQFGRWNYDQALYLRSPGMVLDTNALDEMLSSSDTRQSWAPLNPSSGDNPDVLLRTGRGLQSPRGQTRSFVVSSAAATDEDGTEVEEMSKHAAYVLFEDQTVSSGDQVEWYGNLKKQFDKGTATVCEAGGLL